MDFEKHLRLAQKQRLRELKEHFERAESYRKEDIALAEEAVRLQHELLMAGVLR